MTTEAATEYDRIVQAINEVTHWTIPNGYAGGPMGDKTTAVMVRLDDLRAALEATRRDHPAH